MHKAVCAYSLCQRPFESVRRRECCDRSCAARLAQSRRGLTPWEPDAEMWLEEKAGTMPFSTLCHYFNKMARRKGWGARSENAIHVKVQRLNLSKKCTEDNMTRRELARALGINSDRVRSWTRAGLPWKKIARNQAAIRMADLREFLLANPERATGVPERELGWLIGESAAAIVANAEHSRRGYPTPVVCIDTGEVFPGIKAAARAKFVAQSSIRGAILRGGRSAGYRWAYLNPAAS